jgi:hypothetical protein
MYDLERFLSDLADPRVKILLATLVVSLLAIFGVPQEKQDLALKAVYAMCSLAGIAVGGYSWSQGKMFEGAVPPGWTSVNAPTPTAPPAPQQPTTPAAPVQVAAPQATNPTNGGPKNA